MSRQQAFFVENTNGLMMTAAEAAAEGVDGGNGRGSRQWLAVEARISNSDFVVQSQFPCFLYTVLAELVRLSNTVKCKFAVKRGWINCFSTVAL